MLLRLSVVLHCCLAIAFCNISWSDCSCNIAIRIPDTVIVCVMYNAFNIT